MVLAPAVYQAPTLKKYRLSPDLENKARFLALAGDPTRIRILCVLFQNRAICVSDIAASLEMSVSAISHQLQILKADGAVQAVRMGQNICYGLRNGRDIKLLKKIICG